MWLCCTSTALCCASSLQTSAWLWFPVTLEVWPCTKTGRSQSTAGQSLAYLLCITGAAGNTTVATLTLGHVIHFHPLTFRETSTSAWRSYRNTFSGISVVFGCSDAGDVRQRLRGWSPGFKKDWTPDRLHADCWKWHNQEPIGVHLHLTSTMVCAVCACFFCIVSQKAERRTVPCPIWEKTVQSKYLKLQDPTWCCETLWCLDFGMTYIIGF